AIPRRALPESLCRLVGIGLGRFELVLGRGPGRDEVRRWPVGEDVAAVEGLRRRPHGLGPEAEGLALVRRQAVGGPVARVDRDDRDVLAERTKARDHAAARERDIVGVWRDEDV